MGVRISRRLFLAGSAAPLFGAALGPRERVDRALNGRESDRPPISLWHHFGLENEGPEAHAKATLEFHRRYGTDLVKVMSDFPYPKPAGAWHILKPLDNPFAPHIRALELIRDGLAGKAHFVETIFNPWNVAEKLSSKEEVQRMKKEQPQKLLDALEVIAKSEAAHARLALKTGASGVFLAVANAQPDILSREDYRKFSEPFDRIVLQAAGGGPLNILHLHGDKVYVEHFWKGWPAAAINYSSHETGVPLATARAQFSGVLLAGIDHRNYRTRTVEQLRADAAAAAKACGRSFIMTPGCSVPNESTPPELEKLRSAVS